MPPRDPYLYLGVRRSTLYAFVGSLIVHALVLFVVPPQRVDTGEPPAADHLVVNLRQRMPPPSSQDLSAMISAARPQPLLHHQANASAVPALARSRPKAPSQSRNPAIPPLPSSAAAKPLEDMQAYVDAARARRRAAEGVAGREEAATHMPEPAEDDIRMAIVKRNLRPGANGVFQILSMESYRAAFSFRAWTTESSNSQREYIQVDIGANSHIEIATVRKMIELIRRYQQGDFNWESQRLDRTVILSARLEDNDGLEQFLLREFFGAQPGISLTR